MLSCSRRRFRHIVTGWLLLPSLLLADGATSHLITQAEWSLPRSGDRLLSLPALRGVMTALESDPRTRLQIGHPGGDSGTIWAEELRAWLVALGLASQRISLLPASGSSGNILLTITLTESLRSEQ
jgi:hypothetical protein